jgi:hypothetical protein
MQSCNEYMIPIALHLATLGDVVLYTFRLKHNGDPMHFGVISRLVPTRYVIHGYERVGKVTENAMSATFWKPIAAFQIRGIV